MLSHHLTPPSLSEINQKLESLLHSDSLESINFQLFNDLVCQRHQCVIAHLETLDNLEKQTFAKLEKQSSESLTNSATQLRDEFKQKLSSFKRNGRAIQQFK